LPAQLGAQSQRPVTPPPPHFVPLWHAVHATPPVPQASSARPAAHVFPWQQPLQLLWSQTHPLPLQCSP
jgi:hypothetical protein